VPLNTTLKKEKKAMKIFTLIALMSLLLGGCSSPISKEAKEDMAKPVNCATAEGDIRSLTAEKVHASEQVAAGAKSIVPVSLVLNVVSGTEGDEAKVASGEYNKMLDKKIAEIKQQCGIQ
jgi:PBP1b-binding outer membrane lipoprotein LpoB